MDERDTGEHFRETAYLAVLRVFGRGFDIDRFLDQWPELRPDGVWHEGGTRSGGQTSKTSGCTVLVSEAADVDELGLALRHVLAACSAALADVPRFGAASELDIGLMVGVGGKVTSALELSSDILRSLSEAGIDLRVSAYPVGGDDD